METSDAQRSMQMHPNKVEKRVRNHKIDGRVDDFGNENGKYIWYYYIHACYCCFLHKKVSFAIFQK